MKVGIVGFPQVGKTTIFNLLTRATVETPRWGGKVEAHLGVARVPDPNLDRLAEIFQPKKVTHAAVEYVDIPGWARGEGKAVLEGQAKDLVGYLASLKNVDALVHVVRAFEDASVAHSEGTLDPARDINLFELEMIFSDLAIVEKRLERLAKDLKKVKSPELELEYSVLQRFKSALEQERPLRSMELKEEEKKRIKGFTFLSEKPLLLVLNLGESDVSKIPNVVDQFKLQNQANMRRVAITAVCGKIEAEIASLPEEDADIFMRDLGLAGSGLTRIIQQTYTLLGFISFYTVSEPEARAWMIPRGTTAHQAAGVIHSDFERGFIKAEVLSLEDMIRFGSFHAAKSQGTLRLEGKDYVVQERDVILFRFNI